MSQKEGIILDAYVYIVINKSLYKFFLSILTITSSYISKLILISFIEKLLVVIVI